MANQMIALQARAPQQGNILAPAIQQGAQMVNMMRQQQALDRQTAVAQQQMEIARAGEAREAAMAPFKQNKAEAEAGAAKVKYVSDFMDTSALALANVRDPQQAMAVGNRLKQMFPEPEFQQSIDETLLYLTEDPAQFDARRQESLVRTLDAKDQLTKTFKDQNTGLEQRTLAIPTYGGGPATEVPGSRFQSAQGISYVKGDDGSVRAMPKDMPGTGGFGAPAPAAPMGAPAAGAGGDTFSRMIGVESRGQQFDRSGKPLTSPAGAIGIAQVMPNTAPEAARLAGLPFDDNRYRNDPEYNRAIGKAYYEKQLADFGDERLAAAAYNAGPNAVRRALEEGGPDGWLNRVPRETQNYVNNIFGGASSGRGSAGGGAGGLQFGQVVPGMQGGNAKGKGLTVAEQTASYNIKRLLRGADAIKKAVGRTPEANVPSATEAAVGSLPFISKAVNFTRGADRQIVAAAQRDVLDALLYLATGAAYNKEQLEGQMESYIPAYSDEPSAIESKRERLAQLVTDAKTRAGRGWTPELDEAASTLFSPQTPSNAPVKSRKTPTGVDTNNPLLKG